MVEITLTIVIFALICVIGITQYTSIKEREKLLKLLMERDLKEVTDNEYVEKIPKQKENKLDNDIVEVNPDEDTIFDKAIKAQLKYGVQSSEST